MPYGMQWRRFLGELKAGVQEDHVANGAAALAYYLTLAIFPALILLLSLVPYLPIENVEQAIMNLLGQIVPDQAASMLSGVVHDVASTRRGGLLSLGALGVLWAASNGIYAVMRQLNITYHVREKRPFWKTRAVALGLTFLVGILMIVAFSLVVLGGEIQERMTALLGWGGVLSVLFAVLRWVLIVAAFFLAFSVTYYFAPNVEQKFRFITPGSVFGVIALIGASLLFRLYTSNFSNYSATYGSIGAVVVLMLWLYITGWVLLLGSEFNVLIERHAPAEKS